MRSKTSISHRGPEGHIEHTIMQGQFASQGAEARAAFVERRLDQAGQVTADQARHLLQEREEGRPLAYLAQD